MAMTTATEPDLESPQPRSRRRYWAMVAGATLAFIAIGWSIGWVLLAIHLRSGIDGWMDFRRAMGERLTHGDRVLDGFPLRIRLTYANVAWERVDGPRSLAAATDQLVVWAEPWAPTTLRVATDRPVTGSWTAPSMTATLTATTADGAIALEPGQLDHLELTLDQAVAVDADRRVIARADRIAIQADPTPGAEIGAGGIPTTLTFALSADGFDPADLITPLIPFEGPADGRIKATVRGPLPIAFAPTDLALWRDSGGVIDVEHFGLNWRPLDLTADGTVTLDGLMRPQGAATAEIRGLPAMIDRAERQGLVQSDLAAVLRLAAAAFTRTASDGGSPSVQAPVTIQDGSLSLGPFPVLAVPSVIR
jgi:hypothetical protein